MNRSNNLNYQLYRIHPDGKQQWIEFDPLKDNDGPRPLVSCLMVTRGDLKLLRYSVECYLRQDYPDRELVVVTDNVSVELEDFLAGFSAARVRLVKAPAGLTLGDLRNISVAHSHGRVICQWDDDDLSDPRRLNMTLRALRASRAAAVFLSNLLIWWPARKIFAVSHRRPWEGSMMAWRRFVPIYPAVPKSEDNWVVRALVRAFPIALLEAPELYCYAITGQNTWGPAHFEIMLKKADATYQDARYEEMLAALDQRVPINDYASALAAR